MKSRFATLAVVLSACAVQAQTTASSAARVSEPHPRDLDRLNLQMAWRVSVPVSGSNDGVTVVQALDDQVFAQTRSGLLVCIQSNLDPKGYRKPGEIIWRFKPEQPSGVQFPVAAGTAEVYLVDGQYLYVLNRSDGKVKFRETMPSAAAAGPSVDYRAVYVALSTRRFLAFKVNPDSGRYDRNEVIPGYSPTFVPEIPDPPRSSTLKPDPAEALSSTSNRSPSIAPLDSMRPPFKRQDGIDLSPSVTGLRTVYPPYRPNDSSRSPSVIVLPSLRQVYEASAKEAPTKLIQQWELLAIGKIDDAPLLAPDPLDTDDFPTGCMISYSDRTLFTASRTAERTNNIQTYYQVDGRICAPLTSYDDMLYICQADSSVIALSVRDIRNPALAGNALPRARYPAGTPVEQKPLVTADSLYVVSTRGGLMRLWRDKDASGRSAMMQPAWRKSIGGGLTAPRPNTEAHRLLSVTPNYCYALDQRGNLLVIDNRTGLTLSNYETAGFNVSPTNTFNDRLILSSSNGLVVCLHERARNQPLVHQLPMRRPKPGALVAPIIKKDDPEMKKDAEPKKEPEPKKDEKKD